MKTCASIACLAALAATLAACGGNDRAAVSEPSTAVTTIAPRRGSATSWLTAYGSATPSTSATQTLSIAQSGQVTQLLVTAGARVHAGQPLLTFALAPTVQAAYEAASTALATAIKQRDTTAHLLSQQLATRDQLSQAEKAVADAQAALAAMRREGAGQPEQTMRAPFDGVVSAIPAAQGDRTQPGTPLLTMARLDGIVVTAGLDPAARAMVRPGQKARLVSLTAGTQVDGQVLRIDSQLNPATHMLDVDLTFPAGAILPGEALKVDIATGVDNGWLVPHAAVVVDGDGSAHVFQVAGGKARAVPVKIIQSDARQDVVDGSLDTDRRLVVEGAYQVEDGGAVREVR